MNIIYNGKSIHNNIQNLKIFLKSNNITTNTNGIAVALNSTVIPKDTWEKTILKDNDILEVVSPFQGG